MEGVGNHRVDTERYSKLTVNEPEQWVKIMCLHMDHSAMFMWTGPIRSQHIGWRQLVAHMKWEG